MTTVAQDPTIQAYASYLASLSQLVPLQRALLLLNLQKAHYWYQQRVNERYEALREPSFAEEAKGKGKQTKSEAEDGDHVDEPGDLKEVAELFRQTRVMTQVTRKDEEYLAELEEWWPVEEAKPRSEFQVVRIEYVRLSSLKPVLS